MAREKRIVMITLDGPTFETLETARSASVRVQTSGVKHPADVLKAAAACIEWASYQMDMSIKDMSELIVEHLRKGGCFYD